LATIKKANIEYLKLSKLKRQNMTINIQSNAEYQISPENYTVTIKKGRQDILNKDVLEAINQAIYRAVERVYELKL
jgi:hypothetical protein